ncbi:hypothetical protein P43SY_006869 [Pythium insidiosum]|uniref:Uncharacterized protein n=1 Tax=Pythium insidiosum TaxID=114742 RepID=A0AAD5M7M5_PYTIN|nr:hypothetical protein P43SY_006869 [Pythium insidiosum]
MSRRRLSIGRPRRASRERDGAAEELSHSERLCLALQDALVSALADPAAPAGGGVLHCTVVDVSVAELQYRLLGASRYWYRSIKQEKHGKRWEVQLYEVCCRKSTLSRLRTATSWHVVSRLLPDDVQLRSLGLFDSEKAALHAFDAAFRARDLANPLAQQQSEPLPAALATRFHATVVSDCFARRTQRERLSLIYEALLSVFSPASVHERLEHSPSRLRGVGTVGRHVARLPHWRTLPFDVSVAAKTPAQWASQPSRDAVSDTERGGRSHLRNDRALLLDRSVLPASRGLADLVALNQDEIQARTKSVLPHFYHGLPEELKRMVADEQRRVEQALSHTPSVQKLLRNHEAQLLPKYLKRRRALALAALRLQRVCRRRAQRRSIARVLRRHRAAGTIQRCFRGSQARAFVRALHRVLTCASVVVQSVFRSYASRQRTKELRRRMELAARLLQRCYRGFVARAWVRWIRQMKDSAVVIERLVRGFLARSRAARMRLARHKRRVLQPAATAIQRVWRGHRARLVAAEKRAVQYRLRVLSPAAITLARVLRGFLARRLAERFRRAWQCAIVIQRHWRSHRFYRKWMDLMEWRRRDRMATRIGAVARGYVARKFFRREQRRRYLVRVVRPAAVTIQRVFRGHQVRRRLEDLRDRIEAAITLQQMWRKRHRIRTIQQRLKGFRGALREASAARIQRCYRCFRARQLLAFLKLSQRARFGKAALVVQCAWRSHCSRVQLREFRFCSRVERKAAALTDWKERREDIEFDLEDARADLKRVLRFRSKSLRRVKELKAMRIEWERRQPVVEKELAQLTSEDLDRGWGEAFETEKHVLHYSLELSVEDILARKDQIRECDAEIDDLRLEIEDLERDLEECILGETMELQDYRESEMQNAHRMFAAAREREIRRQKVHWAVRNIRRNVVRRQREDLKLVERELLAQRQVQELSLLGFEKKRQLKEKLELAIESAVTKQSRDNEVKMELRRDAKVIAGFDDTIQRMHKITQQYSPANGTSHRELETETARP